MPKLFKPKYSKKEVSQRFNLKELLGYTPSEQQKRVFYDLIVDKMVERTANGKDISGRNFTPYSANYAERKGVSRNSVDLILTGEMLNSFEESQRQRNVVKVKVSEGENTLKSYNHNVGDTLPRRTYFGFQNEGDLQDVVSQVDQLEPRAQEEDRGISLADLRAAVTAINLDFEGFDGEN